MDLDELKKSLATLTLGELQMLGIDLEKEDSEDVKLMTTSDDHNEKHGEVVWVASINKDGEKAIIISNGMLYTPKEVEETGREVEVGRVYVNAEKAEMLIEALSHAYPELLHRYETGESDASISDYVGGNSREVSNQIKRVCNETIGSDALIDTYQNIKNEMMVKLSGVGGSDPTIKCFSDGPISTIIGTVPGYGGVEIVELDVEKVTLDKDRPRSVCIRSDEAVKEIVAQFKLSL